MTAINSELFDDTKLFEIPAYALPYLANSDPSGLSKEDIRIINKWARGLRRAGYNPCGFTFVKVVNGSLHFDPAAEPHIADVFPFGKGLSVYWCAIAKAA